MRRKVKLIKYSYLIQVIFSAGGKFDQCILVMLFNIQLLKTTNIFKHFEYPLRIIAS